MTKNRLEAFSDGVLAIIITIMVLELRPPDDISFASLWPLIPKILSYIMSFAFIGIYWNNHHHLLHTVKKVNGGILWANLNLLFWLSLIPFTTAWMGEHGFAGPPVALYGMVLLMAAVAYYILVRFILFKHGKESVLAQAIGSDFKGKISVVIYAAAIPCALIVPLAALTLFALVALMWLIPDMRIERLLENEE
ncbi:MAG: TMEM175 family protein [Bacteroidota bacterium]